VIFGAPFQINDDQIGIGAGNDRAFPRLSPKIRAGIFAGDLRQPSIEIRPCSLPR